MNYDRGIPRTPRVSGIHRALSNEHLGTPARLSGMLDPKCFNFSPGLTKYIESDIDDFNVLLSTQLKGDKEIAVIVERTGVPSTGFPTHVLHVLGQLYGVDFYEFAIEPNEPQFMQLDLQPIIMHDVENHHRVGFYRVTPELVQFLSKVVLLGNTNIRLSGNQPKRIITKLLPRIDLSLDDCIGKTLADVLYDAKPDDSLECIAYQTSQSGRGGPTAKGDRVKVTVEHPMPAGISLTAGGMLEWMERYNVS